MTVLGFDPSLTNFGWAVVESNTLTCSTHGRFRTSASTLFVDRYTDLRQKVTDLVERLDVRRVGVESPIFGESYSPGLYGLYLYVCEALRAERCDVVFLSPGQAKAHAREHLARPRGWKMEKADMVEAAKFATGLKLNHNEADAYWIARTASRFWSYVDGDLKQDDLTALEFKQFTEVHTFVRGKHAGETVHRGLAYREGERVFRWSAR